MRSVFSAMRRSLTSRAIVSASSKRGARNRSRSVSMSGIRGCRSVSGEVGSSNVITRASKRRGEPESRLPSWVPRVGPPVRWDPADLGEVYRLFGRCFRHRLNRYEYAALGFGAEFDAPVDQREQGMVLGQADIGAWVPLGAALARNDVASEHLLAAENFQAEPLTMRVATVTG